MTLLRLLTLIVALSGPYLILSLFEWQLHPGDWAWWTRLAMAVVYGFYLFLVLQALYGACINAARKPASVRKEEDFGDF